MYIDETCLGHNKNKWNVGSLREIEDFNYQINYIDVYITISIN